MELLCKIYTFESEQPKHYEILCVGLMSDIWNNTLHYIREQKHYFSSLHTDSESKQKVKDILSYILLSRAAECVHQIENPAPTLK